jgi:hypothetical protein
MLCFSTLTKGATVFKDPPHQESLWLPISDLTLLDRTLASWLLHVHVDLRASLRFWTL